LPVKRYLLVVVSEDINPPAAAEPAPLVLEDSNGRVIDNRTRLQKLLAKQLRNFTMLFARVLAEEDAHIVHDLRVCTRRLQQILSALAPEKNLNKARSVRRTLRRVRRALGPWRNCDVALQWVTRKERRISKPVLKSGWKLVRESISVEREDAIQSARRKLYKSGGITLNRRIQQLLALSAQRLGSADPGAVVRQAVADGAVQGRQALERATADRSIPNIHALRIQTKRLRYRVEMARELGAQEAPALIQWFKLLQDRLGHWHDRQELNHFITRALAGSDVLMGQPRVAVELLREVEKNHKISSREMEELLRTVSQSEGARQLDNWLQSYCTMAVNDSAASPADGATSNAPAQPVLDSAPPREPKVEQSTQGQPEPSGPDGKVDN
jgi:CHAD domain-containing protein